MYNIPNAADASNALQAQPDSRDFHDIIAQAFAGTGVVSGCAVTAQGSPNMTVAVASGNVAIAGTTVAVTGGNVTITTANGSNPRFDLICVDASGVKSAVAGTAGTAPVFPDPAGKCVIAAVLVPTSATAITNAMITDKRLAPVIAPAAITFPTGMLTDFAGSVAPTGWLLCDGSPVSRSTYSTLYSLVGNTYGAGDGSTTFNVPDFRGRAPVGVGTNADVSALGASDGLAVASRSPKHNSTLTGAPGVGTLALPNHTHNVQTNDSNPPHTASGLLGASGDPATIGSFGSSNPTSLPAVTGAPSVGSLAVGPGGTRPADTIGFLAVNKIIKT